MYVEFFGLDENPFSITPDPRYLYMSKRHREALAHLLYGIGEGGGFVQLTGEIGMGKTTLCRGLLDQLPEHTDVALILNPRLTALELVAAVCDELGVSYPADSTSLKVLVDALNHYLLDAHARGHHTVLIIDEAQNLSTDVLEQVRLLTNLETAKKKLLQIILIGQPELKALLERPDLRQLAQRITARYHLSALLRDETAAYVQHRLAIAGLREPAFTKGALHRLHRLSGGIPRRINIIADRAMLGAYAQDRNSIDTRMVKRAADEVLGGRPRSARSAPLIWGTSAALLLLAIGATWLTAPSLLQAVGMAVPAAAVDETDTVAKLEAAPAPPASEPVQETAVPAVETPPAPTIPELLAQNPDAQAMENAFAALFQRWNVDYATLSGATPCERAATVGLRCLHRSGTWNNMRTFNRPAVIELMQPGDLRYYTVVEALGTTEVTLRIGAASHRLPIGDIEPFWFGEYLLLWKPPPIRGESIFPGSRGADVLWLRARLDEMLGPAAPSNDPSLFDAELKSRVVTFQRSRNLVEDGIVGEQTLVYLQAVMAGPGLPALAAAEE